MCAFRSTDSAGLTPPVPSPLHACGSIRMITSRSYRISLLFISRCVVSSGSVAAMRAQAARQASGSHVQSPATDKLGAPVTLDEVQELKMRIESLVRETVENC